MNKIAFIVITSISLLIASFCCPSTYAITKENTSTATKLTDDVKTNDGHLIELTTNTNEQGLTHPITSTNISASPYTQALKFNDKIQQVINYFSPLQASPLYLENQTSTQSNIEIVLCANEKSC